MIDLKYISANNHAGQRIGEIYPHLNGKVDLFLEKWEDINWSAVDVIFSCLPHGIFHEIFPNLPAEKIIIDLSADFRLSSAKDYVEWYNFEHKSVEKINHFVYGLTELNRSDIKKSENWMIGDSIINDIEPAKKIMNSITFLIETNEKNNKNNPCVDYTFNNYFFMKKILSKAK